MRFIIKSFLVTGFTVALLAVLATLFRCFCYLWGDEATKAEAEERIQFFTDADALPKLILEQNKAKADAEGASGGGSRNA